MTSQIKRARAPMVATSYALGFIVLCMVIYILNLAAHIMVPLVMAVFFWYLINAIAKGLLSLEKYGISLRRGFAYTLSILLLLAGLWGVFALIKANALQVAAAAPAYQKQFDYMKPKIEAMLGLDHLPGLTDTDTGKAKAAKDVPAKEGASPDAAVATEMPAEDKKPSVLELAQKFNLAEIIKTLVAIFTGITAATVEVLFFTGFLLYEQRFFDRKMKEMVKDHRLEGKIRHILTNIDDKIQRYIAVKTLVSFLAGVFTYGILKVAKVDFAAFWGLMAFFLHFIPYVGTFGAIALPSIMTLIQFGDIATCASVVLALSVALMGIGHVLDPRLLGDRLNLSPICIILSLAMWGMIWGAPGMFLAIPILSMLVITMSQFDSTRPIAILLSKTGVVDKPVMQKH